MKDISYSWNRRINIVKMSIISKAIYKCNAIPIKISVDFSTEIEDSPKIFMEPWMAPNSQSNLEKKRTKLEALHSLISNYITKLQQSKQYGTAPPPKKRHVDQWNRIKTPEINSHISSQLIFLKKAKNTQYRKNNLLNK